MFFEEEASRYYSNILATFSSSVGRAIDKLEALEPRIIAPAHGIVWRENPERIVQLYRRHVGYAVVLDELGRKKVVRKKAFRFGSYGWSGGAQKELEEITERFRMKWDFVEPYEFAGAPSKQDLENLRERGRRFAAQIKSMCSETVLGQAAAGRTAAAAGADLVAATATVS